MSRLQIARAQAREARARHRFATGLLLVAFAVGACNPSTTDAEHDGLEHATDEHEHHGDEPATPKTDAHHTAENRRECEDDVALPRDALERYGIEVAPVGTVALVATVSAPGHLAFPQGSVARVGSAVAGRVVEIRVRSGDSVAAGDPLLVVDSPALGEAQSDYLQKRTIAAAGSPAVELARSAFERAKELHESVQGVSLFEVQRREAELRRLEGELAVARAAESAVRNRLLLLGMSELELSELEETGKIESRFTIVSPIRGKVVEMSATQGELVDPEKDRLLVVGDLSTLWAIAEVSEPRLAEIAIGAPARVRVPALQNSRSEGRVAAVPTTIEASTRTAEVRIELSNPDGTMLPGMFVQVEIDSASGGGEPRLAVPDGAVLTVEGRPSVFVPLEPGSSIFCKHEIEVGPPIGEHIPVLAGLSAGELVVVAGAFRLKAEHGKAAAQHEH